MVAPVNTQTSLRQEPKCCDKHPNQPIFQLPSGEMVCHICNYEKIKAEQADQQAKRDKAEFVQRRTASMVSNRIDPNARFANWQFVEQEQRQRQLIDKLIHYADTLDETSPNLLIVGATGTGKTFMCHCLAHRLYVKQYRYEPWATDVVIPAQHIKSSDYIAKIKASWDDRKLDSEIVLLDKLEKPNLLILDDVGDNDVSTEKDCTRLGQILERRYHKAPTIITSNHKPQDVARLVGDRGWDRFSEKLVLITFDWGSYRQVVAKREVW
ncbi:ATP-binding protein [Moraxella sp. VT-16-12]|uniref:ATP-binding protein n=1 Tax=Moraxella sp. VT-16-12 TaxID=2014877 RepID=UPI000B7F080B|nr:ATP-binding protein [Moraxella sp. VT-16-12]TWV81528.1 ATP-binding protein [Moraxella sp. VT-16-12]